MKDFFLNNKKLILIIAAVVLVLIVGIVIACVVGGNDTEPTQPTGNAGDANYSVTVSNSAGEPVGNIKVFVYANEAKTEMIWAAVTDASGKINFTVPKSDDYVVVIQNVPAAYGFEESYKFSGEQLTIVLKDQMLNDTDMNVNFAVGDHMMDFSIMDCDGVEYKLSELLKEKKAVVLNFWYRNCNPCKMEFPYIQEAYNLFSADVVVLAMDPMSEDNDASVAQFRDENGLTFPMAKVDEKWGKNVKWGGSALTAYPTTVVIDREGKIVMLHSGMFQDAQSVMNLFGYITAEDYTSRPINDLAQLPVYEIQNSAENPLEISGVTSFNVTVKAGQKMYVNVYNVADMLMSILDKDVTIEYNGQTFLPENGSIEMMVDAPNPFTPVALVIGNSGAEDKSFAVNFAYPEGSMGNPFELPMGEFTADIPEGNDTGLYYSFTAVQSGKLNIKLISATKGVEYDVTVTNKNTYAVKTLGEDAVDGVITMDVNAGDVIEVTVGTFMDAEFKFPAAQIRLKSDFDNGGLAAPKEYSITVKNDGGKGVAAVMVQIKGNGVDKNLGTDSNGNITVSLPAGEYSVTLTVPPGYKGGAGTYQLTETVTKLTVTLEAAPVEPDPGDDPSQPTDPVVPSEPDPEVPGETKDNPITFAPLIDGTLSFEITVRAGWTGYVQLYKVSGMYMEINSSNAQVKWRGKTYKPSNGKISVMMESESPNIPVELQIKNKGDAAETFTIRFYSPKGSMMSPYVMELGEFTAKVPAGTQQGIYYEYIANSTGTLTLECLQATDGVAYKYYLQNQTQLTANQPEISVEADHEGTVTLSIEVKKGDKIRCSIGTLPETGDEYPAGEFVMKATFV